MYCLSRTKSNITSAMTLCSNILYSFIIRLFVYNCYLNKSRFVDIVDYSCLNQIVGMCLYDTKC